MTGTRLYALIRDKRGEEIVEATIVLPLLILMIVSMITIMMIYYDSVSSTSKVQQEIAEDINSGKGLFKVIKRSGGLLRQTKGLVGYTVSRGYSDRGYVIDMGELLRIGRLADEKGDDK